MPLIDSKTALFFILALLIVVFLRDIPNKIFIGGAIIKDSAKRGLNPKLWLTLVNIFPASIVWRFYVYKVNPMAKAIDYEPISGYTSNSSGYILLIAGIISIVVGLFGLITKGIKSDVFGIPVAALIGVGIFFTPYYYLSNRWQKIGKPNPLDRIIGNDKTSGRIIKILLAIILISIVVSIFAFIFVR